VQLADRTFIIIEGSFSVCLIARRLFRTARLSRGFLYTKKECRISDIPDHRGDKIWTCDLYIPNVMQLFS